MSLFRRLRVDLGVLTAWREANTRKSLKQMPSLYLMSVAAPSAAVVMLMEPQLHKITSVFLEQLLPAAPWPINLAVATLVLAWWAIVGLPPCSRQRMGGLSANGCSTRL